MKFSIFLLLLAGLVHTKPCDRQTEEDFEEELVKDIEFAKHPEKHPQHAHMMMMEVETRGMEEKPPSGQAIYGAGSSSPDSTSEQRPPPPPIGQGIYGAGSGSGSSSDTTENHPPPPPPPIGQGIYGAGMGNTNTNIENTVDGNMSPAEDENNDESTRNLLRQFIRQYHG